MRLAALCILASAVFSSTSQAQAPVGEILQDEGSIEFHVKASVA
jgi:hypothetical protein